MSHADLINCVQLDMHYKTSPKYFIYNNIFFKNNSQTHLKIFQIKFENIVIFTPKMMLDQKSSI